MERALTEALGPQIVHRIVYTFQGAYIDLTTEELQRVCMQIGSDYPGVFSYVADCGQKQIVSYAVSLKPRTERRISFIVYT